MKSGVYTITNLVNSHKYIGSSVNILRRWKSHRHELQRNSHRNKHLQSAWNKYGEQSFVFKVQELTDKDLVLDVEQRYLTSAKKHPNVHYNQNYNSTAPTLGMKHSSKTKNKMSRAHMGKILSDEHKVKLSLAKRNTTIYSFKNRLTNETFIGTVFNFIHKYNLDTGNTWSVVTGNRKSTKNWILERLISQ